MKRTILKALSLAVVVTSLSVGSMASAADRKPNVVILLADNLGYGDLGKGGLGTLLVDGKKVAQGRIERTLPFRLSLDETLDCGEDTGTRVSADYRVPFKFTGDLKKVVIDLTPENLTAEDDQKLKEGKGA